MGSSTPFAGGSLADLDDVELSAPGADFLRFDPVSAKWINTPFDGGDVPAFPQRLRVGDFLNTNLVSPVPAGTTNAAGELVALPVWLSRPAVVDQLAVSQSNVPAGGTSVRLGIYENLDGRPGPLILDAGGVAALNAGLKVIAINQALDAGIYWLACVGFVGAPTLLGYGTAGAGSPGLNAGLISQQSHNPRPGVKRTVNLAASPEIPLPNPFGASEPYGGACVYMRIASL